MARLPLLLAALAACLAASRASQWDPHSPSGLGFEGWFLRLTVTSLDAGSSAGRRAPTALTVIVGGAPAAAANRTLAALAVQTADGAAGATFEQLDLQLSVRVPAGSTVTSPPRMWVTADDGSFAWRVEGDACSLTARLRGAELRAHCEGPPVPWSADGLGPEGELAVSASGWCG